MTTLVTIKKRALILFAHGARVAGWAVPFQQLERLTQDALPNVFVSLAYLELMTPTLPELVLRLMNENYEDVTVVPVFLGQGGHLLRDLPLLIAQLKNDYPRLDLQVAGAVGEDAGVLSAISQYCINSLEPNRNAADSG